MRKNFIYNLIGLAFVLIMFASCDQASEEASPIREPNDTYPTATFSTDFTGSTVTEGDTVYYTVTLDKPWAYSIAFSAEVIGGDASDADIEVLTGSVNPWETEAQIGIVFTADMLPEGTESAQIEIGAYQLASKYILNPSASNKTTMNVSIVNYASDILTIVCDWEKDIVINSNEAYHPDYTYLEAASTIDFDFYVYLDDVTNVGGAGTGACPEIIQFDETTLANGTYYIYSLLYENLFCDWEIYEAPETVQHTDVPVTSYYSQQGVFTEIVAHQDPAQYQNTADFDYAWYSVVDFRLVSMFEYKDGVVTVLDYDGTTELGGAKSSFTKDIYERTDFVSKR